MDDNELAVIAAMNYGDGFATGAKLDHRLMSMALFHAIGAWYNDSIIWHDNLVEKMLKQYVKLKQKES